MSEWQPIETAPRDGRTIIAACYGETISYPCYWEDRQNYWREVGWFEEEARGEAHFSRHPLTLEIWLPFPKPPNEPVT